MGLSAVDATAASVAGKASVATYVAAAFTALSGWITSLDWVSLASLGIAVATFLTNWIYKRKHYRLEQQRVAIDEQKALVEEEERRARIRREDFLAQARIHLMEGGHDPDKA